MDRFIGNPCKILVILSFDLKSNMDRFIVAFPCNGFRPILYLKSNMDRFIENFSILLPP